MVPLLDMINCLEGPLATNVHATTLDASGTLAITKAIAHFTRGDQLYENYGQPNYIYLLYHGFVLEEGKNAHDCFHFRDALVLSNYLNQQQKEVRLALPNRLSLHVE